MVAAAALLIGLPGINASCHVAPWDTVPRSLLFAQVSGPAIQCVAAPSTRTWLASIIDYLYLTVHHWV